MPVFAAIPAILGSIGAAAGVTGAGITAGMSIAAGAAIAGGITAGVVNAVGGAQQAAAMKKAAASGNGNATPDASQTVGDPTINSSARANQLGRAALISTSPSGVSGTDPTGRRKLIGND